ncbi:kynurenine/alpha-aminoadipate aminotransferase, mitochondrial-like [Asterias rubens]|uniref:kynurenine/alpha-aminoadipate aminotransferase, mitochondrial-like n=1 Tax=Asterias rubens TaxID=7604 RepID=UPI001454E5C4|nr:kynurenine/alpha-aminoadipate aminotransferase, mitochondrial-like [Asterias rubens]
MDYTRFLNYYGIGVKPPPIRGLADLLTSDTEASASIGCPNTATFPFNGATFNLKDGTEITLTEDDMDIALQYGKTQGMDGLVDILVKMQCDEHHPPTASHETGESKMAVLVAPGSTMSLATFAMICSRENIPIISTVPAYLFIGFPLSDLLSNYLSVDMDADGAKPSTLRKVLSRWTPEDAKNPESGIPRILWLNPCCNNPCGVNTSLPRRKEIYSIAQEYNLIIVEDDPYYYLQESQPRIPSYLSLDVDGRVLRFDSFSKLVAPGLRLAFITGPQKLVTKIQLVFMQSIQMTNGLAQILVCKLLKQWGRTGFEEHMQGVVKLLREKRLFALGLADKWLTGLAEWNVPRDGMFIFFKVYGTGLTSEELNQKLVETAQVILVPASMFYPRGAELKDVAVLRVSVAMASSESMEKVFEGLSKVIRTAREKHSA